jgi:phosphatidylglycerol:prolipoprotein diacylglycerol transferase
VDRIAFQFGSLSVTWYGLCVAAGFWLGIWTAARRAPRAGLSADAVWDMFWVLILGGIVGARAWYVVSYWERDFQNQPFSEVFMIHHGGLVFHGGFVAAALAGFSWCAWRGLSGWRMADVLAPSLALGHAVGRLGCLANGCCYGRRCDLPWGIRYPSRYGLPEASLHPTQAYEMLLGLALAGTLAWLFRRRRFDGQVFAVYLVAYAGARAFVELFRGDYPANALRWGILTPAHWVSAGLLVLGVAVYWLRRGAGASESGPVPAVSPPPPMRHP